MWSPVCCRCRRLAPRCGSSGGLGSRSLEGDVDSWFIFRGSRCLVAGHAFLSMTASNNRHLHHQRQRGCQRTSYCRNLCGQSGVLQARWTIPRWNRVIQLDSKTCLGHRSRQWQRHTNLLRYEWWILFEQVKDGTVFCTLLSIDRTPKLQASLCRLSRHQRLSICHNPWRTGGLVAVLAALAAVWAPSSTAIQIPDYNPTMKFRACVHDKKEAWAAELACRSRIEAPGILAALSRHCRASDRSSSWRGASPLSHLAAESP